MKEGWEVKKLGDVCEINYGTRVVQKKDGGTIYPVYGGGGATFKMDRYNREDCIVVSRFAMSNQCVRYVRGKFFLNDSGLTVKTKEEKLSQEYLDKCIFSLNDKIYSLGKGVAQKNLDMKEFRHLDINYPCSIDEQSRIVEELDQLANIIEKKRQQLSELDNLAQSIFYDMFGDPDNSIYEIVKLSEIAKCKMSYGSGASAIQYDGNIRYVRITDIKEDGTLSDEKMSPNVVDDKYMLYEGDILFARSGATVGKTYLYNNKDGKSIYAGYLIRFVADTNIVIPKYIYYYTRTTYYKAFIAASAQAVAQPNINAQQFGNLKVCIPPLELQQLFAQKIEAIEKEKELIKQSIKETEELFNSRMDYYFG